MDVLKPTDLATEDFFSDLRQGNFILVLGAGFSCKIKNRVEQKDVDAINEAIKKTKRTNYVELSGCSTIPLARHFTLLTNKIFNTKFNETDSTAYSKSANTWVKEHYSINDYDLTPFFRKLFQPDEASLRIEDDIYKNIFNANWNNIYTFNFDTVLEEILRIKGQLSERIVAAYPERTSLPNHVDFYCIAHLHGIITTSDLNNLVFGDSSYTNIRTKAQQTLYDYFHGELEQGKKALIIGTRFDESVIDDKLFHDLKHPYIYYLGLQGDIDNVQGKSFISGNPNARLVQITDVKEVLNFFANHKSDIENIQIAGASVITRDFINEKKIEGDYNKFGPDEFYLAKQKDDIQWYGVIRGWDVKREAYQNIKREVKQSFLEERTAKITAIIHGRGGSGKSTFLRGLAIDLADEDFAVLWINDAQIDTFYEKGLKQLDEYPDKQFLILIEDWYRNKKQIKDSAQQFINSICNYPNVRIVIGDRTIDNTILKEHRYNLDENVVELTVKDNKKTIASILGNIAEWKPVADRLLVTPDDYNSSLYLILWTIARTFQKNSSTAENAEKLLKQKGMVGHFIDLVESDLNAIANQYPGLAKMIFYWASVYKTNKIYICYDSFLMLAKVFDEGREIDSSVAFLPDSELKPILDIYINNTTGMIKSAGQLSLIAFNHDILAEEGISQAKLTGWNKFSAATKLKILDVLVDGEEGFSASSFLNYALGSVSLEIMGAEKRMQYINKLYGKGNYRSYIRHVFLKNNGFTESLKDAWAKKILNKYNEFDFDGVAVVLALKQLDYNREGGTFATQILERFGTEKIDPDIIFECLISLKDNPEGISYAIQILERFKSEKINPKIVSACMVNLHGHPAGVIFGKQLLYRFKGEKMYQNFISNCLINLRGHHEGISFAADILERFKSNKINHAIISNCLVNLKGHQEGITFAIGILERFKSYKIDHAIISNCLINLKGYPEGISFATDILERFKSDKIDHAIISNCLINLKGHQEEISFATDILERFKTEIISFEIICNCLIILKDYPEGVLYAKQILARNHIDKIDYAIVCNCLIILKSNPDGVLFATQILERFKTEIINHAIISNCLINLKGYPEGISYATQILERFKTDKIDYQIISNCLIVLRDTEFGIKYASNFLKGADWRRENWSIVFQALNCYSLQTNPPDFVSSVVEQLIKDQFDKGIIDKRKFFRYTNIMKIPFHNISIWKRQNEWNILNGTKQPVQLIISAILSNSGYPESIKPICESILRNWRKELIIKIPQGIKDPHYGDHIMYALGHPALNALALKTANEIIEAKNENTIQVPDYLFTVAQKIVASPPEFPIWNLRTGVGHDTE